MNDCCNISYQNKFNQTRAGSELENYKREGLREMSLPIFKIIKDLPLSGLSLLDIGGGIGGITFELFKKGIIKSTYVDISQSYVDCFKQEVMARNLGQQITTYKGDFVDIESNIDIPPADIVVLDKVICCYSAYDSLVESSTSKALKWYAYSIPHDVWWVKFWHPIRQAVRYVMGNKFKSYVHPCKEIEHKVQAKGFKLIQQDFYKEAFFREWQIMLFQKVS